MKRIVLAAALLLIAAGSGAQNANAYPLSRCRGDGRFFAVDSIVARAARTGEIVHEFQVTKVNDTGAIVSTLPSCDINVSKAELNGRDVWLEIRLHAKKSAKTNLGVATPDARVIFKVTQRKPKPLPTRKQFEELAPYSIGEPGPDGKDNPGNLPLKAGTLSDVKADICAAGGTGYRCDGKDKIYFNLSLGIK